MFTNLEPDTWTLLKLDSWTRDAIVMQRSMVWRSTPHRCRSWRYVAGIWFAIDSLPIASEIAVRFAAPLVSSVRVPLEPYSESEEIKSLPGDLVGKSESRLWSRRRAPNMVNIDFMHFRTKGAERKMLLCCVDVTNTVTNTGLDF